MEIYTWIVDNGVSLVNIATAIVTAASLVAAFTKNTKDDSLVNTLRAIVNFLAINVKNAKPKD